MKTLFTLILFSAAAYAQFGTARQLASGPTDPATCNPPQVFFNTTSGTAKACVAANTWGPMGTDANGNLTVGATCPAGAPAGSFCNLRIWVGGNTASGDDSAILLMRAATNPLSAGGSHGVRDEGTYISSGADGGYASFDSIPVMSGSIAYNHLRGFQSRPNFSGSSTIGQVATFHSQPTISSGTATNVYGLYTDNPLGAGAITNYYGLWINNVTNANVTNKFGIYVPDTGMVNYVGGSFQAGGVIRTSTGFRIDTGFTTYGSVLSHDASGNFLDNPNLTIVNGVLTMAYSTAKINASATDLHLASTSGSVVTDNVLKVNGGTSILYRCSVAGTLRAGQLTTVSEGQLGTVAMLRTIPGNITQWSCLTSTCMGL